jgi:hypothetical protein
MSTTSSCEEAFNYSHSTISEHTTVLQLPQLICCHSCQTAQVIAGNSTAQHTTPLDQSVDSRDLLLDPAAVALRQT